MKLETERLIIRNFTLKDTNDLLEYMLQRVNEEFEAYPWFKEEMIQQEIKNRSESDEFYAIELKETHKVIGNIYLGKRDFNSRELGYVLNKNYMRQGYAIEAAKAMIDYFFQMGLHRIYAETTPKNIASWKLMEKLGLKREAFFKQNVSFKSDENGNPIYLDTYVYAALNPKQMHE